MRARTLLLLLLAVLLAGGTVILARNYLATQQNSDRGGDADSAGRRRPNRCSSRAGDIKRGQILRPEDMTWQIWPEGALDKNYIVLGGPPLPARTPESFAGWVAAQPDRGRASRSPRPESSPPATAAFLPRYCGRACARSRCR